MYRIFPLLGDVGLGIFTFILVSIHYDEYALSGFVLALACSHLPDLDAVEELFRRGKLAASAENPRDHREAFHKPLLVLTTTGMLWYFFGYHGAIAFTALLFHFIHDSVLTGWGVPWLSPFSDTRFKFFVNEKNQNSLAFKNWIRVWREEELEGLIIQYGDENWVENLYRKPTEVSVIEVGTFIISVVSLIWLLLV